MHGSSSYIVSSCERKVDPKSNDEHDINLRPPLHQTWMEEHKAVQAEVFAKQINCQSVTMKEVLTIKQTHTLLKHSENKRLLDK